MARVISISARGKPAMKLTEDALRILEQRGEDEVGRSVAF